jgi:F-type H+-transporting ATPase subunit b
VTIARGKDVIDAERKRAMEDLSKSVIDLSVEIAGKIVGNDLSDDEHRALAAKYLQEVGDSDAR